MAERAEIGERRVRGDGETWVKVGTGKWRKVQRVDEKGDMLFSGDRPDIPQPPDEEVKVWRRESSGKPEDAEEDTRGRRALKRPKAKDPEYPLKITDLSDEDWNVGLPEKTLVDLARGPKASELTKHPKAKRLVEHVQAGIFGDDDRADVAKACAAYVKATNGESPWGWRILDAWRSKTIEGLEKEIGDEDPAMTGNIAYLKRQRARIEKQLDPLESLRKDKFRTWAAGS